MDRRRIELAKQVIDADMWRLAKQESRASSAEVMQAIAKNATHGVAGLTQDEFATALQEVYAENERFEAIADKVQALAERLSIDPSLSPRVNLKRWADAGDREAIEILGTGLLNSIHVQGQERPPERAK